MQVSVILQSPLTFTNMKTYIDKHKQRFLDELMTLLRMPSISADSAYQEDVLKTADAVASFLTAAGANNVDVC